MIYYRSTVNINKYFLEEKALKKIYEVPTIRLLFTAENLDVLTTSDEKFSEKFSDISDWFEWEEAKI